jgi:hypothetical protein
MARGQRQQKATEADETPAVEEETQDVSAYIGVDPVYMNYSDERNKPYKAELEEDEDGNDNSHVVEAEETAYAHQAAIRESSGQDPETGEAIAASPDEEYETKRGAYTHEAQWSPNQATSNNTGVGVATMDQGTGSTETVNQDGTTGDKSDDGTPSNPTPPAPPAS